jgi:hypothetical protein
MSDIRMVSRSNIKSFVPLLSELSDGVHPPHQNTVSRTRLTGQGLGSMVDHFEVMSAEELEQLFNDMNAMMIDVANQLSEG